jgi:serine protease Do
LGLDRPVGVLLNQVAADGPAARAGLSVGDVITSVDGFETADPQALQYRIATKTLGTTVRIDYHRNGKSQTATMTLVKAPETVPRDLTPIRGKNPLSGATLGNLSPAFAEELGMENVSEGVVIVSIEPNSIAGQFVQLRPGDLVISIDGEAISRAADAKRAVATPRPQWRMVIKRNDQLLNVVVPG